VINKDFMLSETFKEQSNWVLIYHTFNRQIEVQTVSIASFDIHV